MANNHLLQFSHPDQDGDLRFARLRLKAEVSAPFRTAREEISTNDPPAESTSTAERLQISLAVDEHGYVGPPDDLNPELILKNAWLESTTGEMLQRLEIREQTLAGLAQSDAQVIELNDEALAWLQPRESGPSLVWNREGIFIVLGQTEFDFSQYRLFAAPMSKAEAQRLRDGLGLNTGETNNWSTMTDPDASALDEVRFHLGEIGFDGRFKTELPRQRTSETGEYNEIGWAWLLSGPRTAIGLRADDVGIALKKDIAILLPRNFMDGESPAANGKTGGESPSARGPCPHQSGAPPLDASEEQILDHASLFSDDPGPFCQPFKNPERVLGERRFNTILRVDQPEIAAAAGIKARRIGERLDLPIEDTITGINDGIDPATVAGSLSGRSPAGLPTISEMWNSPLAREQRRRGRKVPSGATLIEWEADTSDSQAVTVARGHILEWRVRWRSNGYSLGNVAHSLTLAPRQIKRIMKVDWERRERARRVESLEIDDSVLQTTDSSRDYSDAVHSELSEWSSGSSRSSTTSAAAGAGFAMGGFVVGGGVAHGSAKSKSEAEGERQVAAGEEQKLRDAIRQYGESVRNLESTVVTEVAQEESAEAVSETIANPNFCHSLTVVYYEILRHLRVDTELVGVSECLFVPFSITPLTERSEISGRGEVLFLNRVLRYRDVLKRYLRDRNLRWVFRYLDDYQNDYKDRHGNTTVPDGPRTSQVITSLRGQIEVKLNLRSPLTGDEDEDALGELAEDVVDSGRRIAARISVIAKRLQPLSPIMGSALSKVAGAMAEKSAEERDREYQREVAPDVARNFLDRLQLFAGGTEIPADFTMHGEYRQNGTHTVSFSVSASALESLGLTRERISELKLSSEYTLPIYSVANVTRGRIHFSTDHYERWSSTGSIRADLAEIPHATEIDGQPVRYAKAAEALLSFPPTSWERQHLREQIETDLWRLADHLESHRHYYHKAIWWHMDRDELYTLLDGYVISETNHRSIASVVERRPIAILGNTLVFRVGRGSSVSNDEDEAPDRVFARYASKGRKSEPMRVSLPTDGLYAQALKDECNACEEHYGNTDWVLERDEITPQELDSNLLSSRRVAPEGLTPSQMPESLINIQNAPQAPTPSGLQGALGAVTKGDSFRDMAGLAGTQANARAAMQQAAALASQFGNLASKQADANRAAAERIESSNLPEEQKRQRHKDIESSNHSGESMTDKQARHGKGAADSGFEYRSKTTSPDGTATETSVTRPANETGVDLSKAVAQIRGGAMEPQGGDISPDDPLDHQTILSSWQLRGPGANIFDEFFVNDEAVDRIGEEERTRAEIRGFFTLANPRYTSKPEGNLINRIAAPSARLLSYIVFDFPVGSAEISEDDVGDLKNLLSRRGHALLKEGYQLQLTFIGRTDSTGSEEINETLRLQRAKRVVELVGNANYVRTRRWGRGSDPVSPHANEYQRALNRSVEIIETVKPVVNVPFRRMPDNTRAVLNRTRELLEAGHQAGEDNATIGLKTLDLYEKTLRELRYILKEDVKNYYIESAARADQEQDPYKNIYHGARYYFRDARDDIDEYAKFAPNMAVADDIERSAELLGELLTVIGEQTYEGLTEHRRNQGVRVTTSWGIYEQMSDEFDRLFETADTIYHNAEVEILRNEGQVR